MKTETECGPNTMTNQRERRPIEKNGPKEDGGPPRKMGQR